MTHKLSTYGWDKIAYCTLCSAEGEELLYDCPGKYEQSTERRKMADHLNLHPDMPETWPLDIIDNLICLEKAEGSLRLIEELRKLMKHP